MTLKRKRKQVGKKLIIISSIVLLNMMGVSYAYWTDQLQIVTTLSTGGINPVFSEGNIKIVRADGDENDSKSTLSNLNLELKDDNHTIVIKGDIEEGYKAIIDYGINNNGTIPIKYNQNPNNSVQQEELIVQDGLKILLNQQPGIIEPKEKLLSERGNSNPKIQIQVPSQKKDISSQNTQEQNSQSFELRLPFDQWTKN